jgi:hypothetical protein
MTKRRLTHRAVIQTTHRGAPITNRGTAESCALAAKTSKLIMSTMDKGSPEAVMATPVTKPHAIIPGITRTMSRMPWRMAG